MKKILLAMILLLTLTAQTHAGLFEYYLGVPTATTPNDPDTLESLESEPTRVYSIYDKPTYTRPNRIDPNYAYQTYPRESYYEYIRHRDGYYSCSDAKNILRDELRSLRREADDIDDYKRDLHDEISDLRRYKPYYYKDRIREIEYRIDRVEEREKDVEDAIKEVQRELRYADSNCYRNQYYYLDDVYYGNVYQDTARCRVYEDTTPYATRPARNSYYIYGKNSWYEVCRYEPEWVNPNLRYLEKDEGYIYIR